MIRILTDDPLLLVPIIIFVIIGMFFGFDIAMSDKVLSNATVIEKHYTPSQHTSGTGIYMGGNGNTGVIVTNNSQSEKFTVIIKRSDGAIESARCKPEIYFSKKEGDVVTIAEHFGGLSGIRYFLTCSTE
jgi:uncharacterized protein YpmB